MILEEITMTNFKSHKNTHIDFSEGISVILGQNGAGKSTILEAIRFVLFKKQDVKIDDLVRKPSDINDNSKKMKVNLKFMQNNIHYEIERTRTKSSNSSKLTRNDNGIVADITTGDTAVTHEVEQILGVDKDSFLNAVYIQQGEITSLIDKTASDKKQLIAKLLNLDNLEKSWQNMKNIQRIYEDKDQINRTKLENKQTTLEKEKQNNENITKITQELEEQTQSKEKLEKEVKELEKQNNELEEKKSKYEESKIHIKSLTEKIEDNKKELENLHNELKNIEEKEKENESIAKEIAKLPTLKELVDVKEKYDNKTNELKDIVESIKKILKIKEDMKNTKEDYEKSEEFNKKLEIIMQNQESIKKDVDEYKTLNSSTETLKKQRDDLLDTLETRARQARDILNNQDLKNPEEITAEYNKQFEENENKKQTLTDEVNGYKLKISSNNTIIKNTKKSLNDLQNTTDKCPICQSDISHDKHESLQKQYLDTITEHEESNVKLNEKIQTLKNEITQVDQRIAQIKEIKTQVMQEDYKKFREYLKQIKENNKTLESLEEKNELYNANEEQIKELNINIKKLENNKQSYLTNKNTLKELKDIDELESNKKTIEDELSNYKNHMLQLSQKVPINDDINLTIKHLENQETIYNKNYGIISNKEIVSKKIETINNKLTSDNNNLDNYNRELRELSFDEESYEKTKDEYRCADSDLRNLEKKVIENKTLKEQYEKNKKELEDNIQEYEIIEKEQTWLKDYNKLLEKIRELYSKNGVQKDLREASKPQIELETNRIFNDFNFNYDEIELNEDYDITIKKGEEILDVSMLSGGEKIVVALALRLAIAKVISKQKNELLILDEPTVHLDEERKQDLIEILRQSDVSNQMLIVTHDSDLIGISENIIEIRKNNGISSYVSN